MRSQRGTAPADRRPSRLSARLSNVPVPEQTLACVALGLFWRHRRTSDAVPSPVARVSGALTIATGAVVVVRAWRAAGDVRLSRPDVVVRDGPFAHSRNPMYLGWGLMHLGLATSLRSLELLATIPLACALMHREVLREEAALAARLGAEYTEYRRAVPRYFRLGPALGASGT